MSELQRVIMLGKYLEEFEYFAFVFFAVHCVILFIYFLKLFLQLYFFGVILFSSLVLLVLIFFDRLIQFCEGLVLLVNLLTLKSDKHLIFPYNITPESYSMFIRKRKLSAAKEAVDCNTSSPCQHLRGMYREQQGEYLF